MFNMHFLTMIISTEIIAKHLHGYNCLWQVTLIWLSNYVEKCVLLGQRFSFRHGGGQKSLIGIDGGLNKIWKICENSSTLSPADK